MKLSKECIELIQHLSEEIATKLYDPNSQKVSEVMECTQWDNRRHNYARGATEALTNPSIFEKAGLISLEDAFEFLGWTREKAWGVQNQDRYSYQGKWYTTAQLFQIYQQQKEK